MSPTSSFSWGRLRGTGAVLVYLLVTLAVVSAFRRSLALRSPSHRLSLPRLNNAPRRVLIGVVRRPALARLARLALATTFKSEVLAFEKYLEEAQELLGKTEVDCYVAKVAMKMMRTEFEQRDSLRKQQLTYLTQRFVVESFLSLTLAVLESEDFKHCHKSLEIDAEALEKLCTIWRNPQDATMISLNEVLVGSPKIREFVWSRLGLTCPFPTIDMDLLSGSMSNKIHNPDIEATFVSEGVPEDLREFFVQISKFIYKRVEMVSPASAAAGREKLRKDIEDK